MKALQVTAPGKIEIVETGKPVISGGQALVKMKAAALNRRDQWIREGKYPGIRNHTTLGSDGCGKVVAVFDQKNERWRGKDVIINPNVNWGNDPTVQSSEYSVLGMPTHGTFAEYLQVDVSRLIVKPEHLNYAEAAALPLAGLTAFRATMKHGKINENSNVLISGFGGGVAQFAFQFATALGATVYVTSGNENKLRKAVEMGAEKAFDYTTGNWQKEAFEISGGFDVIIDSSGGDQLNSFIKITKPGGRIVFYGATNGLPSSLDLYRMFWNQITLQGSTMGSDEEFEEMIEFAMAHKLRPKVDSVRNFDDIIDAFEQMKVGDRLGKLVVEFS